MTRRTAWIVVTTLSGFFAVLNIHVFFMYDLQTASNSTEQVCVVMEKFGFWDSYVIAWAGMTLYTLLPSAIIIAGNITIVYKLHKSRKMKAFQEGTTEVKKSISKIIPMLLVVSTVFVASTLPLGIFYIGELVHLISEESLLCLVPANCFRVKCSDSLIHIHQFWLLPWISTVLAMDSWI